MEKYSLIVGYSGTDDIFVVDDLDNVNELYGAMRSAVETGYRLIDVSINVYGED